MNIIALYSAWNAWRISRSILRKAEKAPAVTHDAARKLEDTCELIFKFLLENMSAEAIYAAQHGMRVVDTWEPPDDQKIARVRAALKRVLKYGIVRGSASTLQESEPPPLQPETQNRVPGPYVERFPVGSIVRIKDADFLRKFMSDWKLHHPLNPAQIQYADQTSRVKSVSFYHGGDVLYMLLDTNDFVWHEQCLQSA